MKAESSRKLALGLCAATTVAIAAMLVVTAATGATQEAHEYTVAPAEFAAALRQGPGATRLLFAIDTLFLILYTLLFAALADYLVERGRPRTLVRVALGAIVAAALLDLVENHHILSLLDLAEHGESPSAGAMVFQQTLSGVKFSGATLGLVAFGLAIPRVRPLGWVLSGFLVVGTLATLILNNAAPPEMRPDLDHGRWLGFLVGFVLAGLWLRTERDPS